MRVLVVGSGAREHAICWRLRQAGAEVWAAPGNAGYGPVAQCVPVGTEDAQGLRDAAVRLDVDLVVIGPEAPLVAGVADHLRSAGLAVLGPSAAAARLEGSKGWAKAFCRRYGIPIPDFEVAADMAQAMQLARRQPLPMVCKADGLMGGKGVVVAQTRAEALEAAQRLAARGPVVFEEFLEGEELSAFALCDGRQAVFAGVARDHKQLQDGGAGPMTGGMGAFAPVPGLAPGTVARISSDILQAVVAGMAREGHPFVGVLFAGLMLTADGPRVLEFNCRWGDPEAQVLLPLLDGDPAAVWQGAACQALDPQGAIRWRPGYAVGVVLAAPGYPQSPAIGGRISGLDADGQVPGACCFHGGTRRAADGWYTAGGRVLTVVAQGQDLPAARAAAYRAAGQVAFPGRQWRTDIGARA